MWNKLLPLNQHPVERVLRIIVGIALLSLIFVGPQSWWGLLGLIPLATGLLGSCPLYTMTHFKTCRGKCTPLLPSKNAG